MYSYQFSTLQEHMKMFISLIVGINTSTACSHSLTRVCPSSALPQLCDLGQNNFNFSEFTFLICKMGDGDDD